MIANRNISFTVNLTRWNIIENGLQQILQKQIDALEYINTYSEYGKSPSAPPMKMVSMGLIKPKNPEDKKNK